MKISLDSGFKLLFEAIKAKREVFRHLLFNNQTEVHLLRLSSEFRRSEKLGKPVLFAVLVVMKERSL
jgi:hypothetical protein